MRRLTWSNPLTMNRKCSLWLLLTSLLLTSCGKQEPIEPHIHYMVQEQYLQSLPSPFTPLSTSERLESWGHEYTIGRAFAKELDLYPAVSTFRRAEVLLKAESPESFRKPQIEYDILLSYYLGRRYQQVVDSFDLSSLRRIDSSFPAFQDLLVVLYDSFIKIDKPVQAEAMRLCLESVDPTKAKILALSTALQKGEVEQARTIAETSSQFTYVNTFLDSYESQRKSVAAAQGLNAILPGAGYLYLGQKQSAATAFLLNGLFIAAAVYSFQHGNMPAGIILTSFELGWYVGGIHGAREEALLYNERLYERGATPLMNQHGLFPIFQIRHSF